MSADIVKQAFEIVTSMENDLEDARVLPMGCHSGGGRDPRNEKLGRSVFADRLADRGALRRELEERRGELFKLLHPNRDQFEQEGWPDEQDGPPPAG